jgi:hypothetical protein
MAWSDETDDDNDRDDEVARQAPWVRPGGYRFMMAGTFNRIPAFQGEDDDD